MTVPRKPKPPPARSLPGSREWNLWLQTEVRDTVGEKTDRQRNAARKLAKFDDDGNLDDSGKDVPTGALVGDSDEQTLTGKTLETPTIANMVNAQHNHQAAAGGGQLDHGSALTGLTDDDHTQYLLVTGTRDVTGDLRWAAGKGPLIRSATKVWRITVSEAGAITAVEV